MKYKFENRELNIPDKEIQMYKQKLDLTESEAIELWLEDNDYMQNEVVEELTKKAKENKSVIHEAKSEKPRKKVEKVVENPTKEKIIEQIYYFLAEFEHIYNLKVTNKTKLIEFEYNGKEFKLDLIEKRKKKE